MNEDRYFDPDPTVRAFARTLYRSVKDLPIISPHGHVEARLFADNVPFPNPTDLFLAPDHYLYRMLYSQGISMESLGIPRADKTRGEDDPRKAWQIFAEHYHLFAGTPSRAWLDYEFEVVLGIREQLNGKTAQAIFDQISETLAKPEFSPRALYDRFKIEVLATTDAASDELTEHQKLRRGQWPNRIIPTFRPDGVTNLADPQWRSNIRRLGEASGQEIRSYGSFIKVLEARRAWFKSLGASATDHGVVSPFTHRLSPRAASELFQKALRGKATRRDASAFTAHMLMEMARMSVEDGLVMQLHPGADRNHNALVAETYGPDKGADIPLPTEYTQNLKELLNSYGNDPRFSLVVFTLDESTYARELAPLAGHYPAMRLGPPWWFHDSIHGMERFRERVTETAGFYNTTGFVDDTRAFLSIPARHDLARRLDANFLARLISRHILSEEQAHLIVRELAIGLVKKAYHL